MKLKSYISDNGMTYRQFGEKVGASERAVIKWCRGERVPRQEMLRKIEAGTAGTVTANDFIEREEAA